MTNKKRFNGTVDKWKNYTSWSIEIFTFGKLIPHKMECHSLEACLHESGERGFRVVI